MVSMLIPLSCFVRVLYSYVILHVAEHRQSLINQASEVFTAGNETSIASKRTLKGNPIIEPYSTLKSNLQLSLTYRNPETSQTGQKGPPRSFSRNLQQEHVTNQVQDEADSRPECSNFGRLLYCTDQAKEHRRAKLTLQAQQSFRKQVALKVAHAPARFACSKISYFSLAACCNFARSNFPTLFSGMSSRSQ